MAPGAWQINIVGHDVKPASYFLANAKNIRIHPRAQSQATEGSLNELGWVKSVTVNKRTAPSWGPGDRGVETLLDGHDRIKLALRRGEATPVPVEYVDLDEHGEDIFLAIIDEITALALNDKEKQDVLVRGVRPADVALQQFFTELYEAAHLVQYAAQPTDAHYAEHPFAEQAVEAQRDVPPDAMPGAVRHFQIFLAAEDYEWMMATLATLAGRYDTSNYTATLLAALREVSDD